MCPFIVFFPPTSSFFQAALIASLRNMSAITHLKLNYTDLDMLESPILSPGPNTSSLQYIPGSALADRIFNDPDAWEEAEGDDGDIPEDVDESESDPLGWLVDEIEKFKRTSIPNSGRSSESKSALLAPLSDFGLKPATKRSQLEPISLDLFENNSADFSKDIQTQLSRILESGGISHHIRLFPNDPISAGSSSSSDDSSSFASGSTRAQTGRGPSFQIPSASLSSSNVSPVQVHSASATLSFLEWYGIYPDSPGSEVTRKLTLVKKKTMRARERPKPRNANSKDGVPKVGVPAISPRQAAFTRQRSPEVPRNPPGLPKSQFLTTATPLHPRPTSPLPALPAPSTSRHVATPSVTSVASPPNLPQPVQSALPTPSRQGSADSSHAIRRLPSIPPTTTDLSSTPHRPLPSNHNARPSLPTPSARPPLPSLATSGGLGRTSSPAPQHPTYANPGPGSAVNVGPSPSATPPPGSAVRHSTRSALIGPVGPRTRSSSSSTITLNAPHPLNRSVLSPPYTARTPGLRH